MDTEQEILALRKENDYLRRVIDAFPVPMIAIGIDYKVKLANREARLQQFLGGHEEDDGCCFKVFHDVNQPCDGEDHPCPLQEVARTGEAVTTVHRHHRQDGRTQIVKLEASPIFDERGNLLGIVENVHDITSSVEREHKHRKKVARLVAMAHQDPLTQLPNRMLFKDRLEHAVAKARRYGKQLAVLFIDLDNFKDINDNWGHDAGDYLLNVISRRFRKCLRESDTVARIGGDEFIMIVDELDDVLGALSVAKKLLDEVAIPIFFANYDHVVTASIGISLYPMHGETADELMKRSDSAMYEAKKVGGDSYTLYQPEVKRLTRGNVAS